MLRKQVQNLKLNLCYGLYIFDYKSLLLALVGCTGSARVEYHKL